MKEQNNFNEIEDLAHRACRLYQQQGSPEAGAGALDKAAKMVESHMPQAALNLYQHAVEVVMVIIYFYFMCDKNLAKCQLLKLYFIFIFLLLVL